MGPTRGARRWVVVFGGVVVAVVLAVAGFHFTRSKQTVTLTLLVRTYHVGECVIWDQSPPLQADHAPRPVDCNTPHLIEMTGHVDLPAEPQYPSPHRWTVIARRCYPIDQAYLGHEIADSWFSMYGRDWIRPNLAAWEEGEHRLECGLGLREVDLALHARTFYPVFRGAIRTLAQVSRFQVGDCIWWDAGPDPIGTVPCTASHQYEVIKILDLRDFGGGTLTGDALRLAAQSTCEAALRTYVRGSVPANVGAVANPLTAEEVRSGEQQFQCIAGRNEGGTMRLMHAPLR